MSLRKQQPFLTCPSRDKLPYPGQNTLSFAVSPPPHPLFFLLPPALIDKKKKKKRQTTTPCSQERGRRRCGSGPATLPTMEVVRDTPSLVQRAELLALQWRDRNAGRRAAARTDTSPPPPQHRQVSPPRAGRSDNVSPPPPPLPQPPFGSTNDALSRVSPLPPQTQPPGGHRRHAHPASPVADRARDILALPAAAAAASAASRADVSPPRHTRSALPSFALSAASAAAPQSPAVSPWRRRAAPAASAMLASRRSQPRRPVVTLLSPLDPDDDGGHASPPPHARPHWSQGATDHLHPHPVMAPTTDPREASDHHLIDRSVLNPFSQWPSPVGGDSPHHHHHHHHHHHPALPPSAASPLSPTPPASLPLPPLLPSTHTAHQLLRHRELFGTGVPPPPREEYVDLLATPELEVPPLSPQRLAAAAAAAAAVDASDASTAAAVDQAFTASRGVPRGPPSLCSGDDGAATESDVPCGDDADDDDDGTLSPLALLAAAATMPASPPPPPPLQQQSRGGKKRQPAGGFHAGDVVRLRSREVVEFVGKKDGWWRDSMGRGCGRTGVVEAAGPRRVLVRSEATGRSHAYDPAVLSTVRPAAARHAPASSTASEACDSRAQASVRSGGGGPLRTLPHNVLRSIASQATGAEESQPRACVKAAAAKSRQKAATSGTSSVRELDDDTLYSIAVAGLGAGSVGSAARPSQPLPPPPPPPPEPEPTVVPVGDPGHLWCSQCETAIVPLPGTANTYCMYCGARLQS